MASDEVETILKCNLKYYAHHFFKHRQGNPAPLETMEKSFQDWQDALECVAFNVSRYG
jgi:hypothetical protein